MYTYIWKHHEEWDAWNLCDRQHIYQQIPPPSVSFNMYAINKCITHQKPSPSAKQIFL